MQSKTFVAGMRAVLVSLPFGKKIESEDLHFIWLTLDDVVKESVTDAMWVYACKMLMECWDHEHHSSQPIHIQALSFLYRECNNRPMFDWGIKESICKQFNLPPNHGTTRRLQASSEGRNQQGLLDAGEPGPTLAGLGF